MAKKVSLSYHDIEDALRVFKRVSPTFVVHVGDTPLTKKLKKGVESDLKVINEKLKKYVNLNY